MSRYYVIIMLLVVNFYLPISSQTKKMEDTYLTGVQALQEGNTDIAISCFEDVLCNIDKHDCKTYSELSYLLGICYATTGQPVKACQLFEQASNNNPTLLVNIYPQLLKSYSEINSPKTSLTAMQMEKLLKEQKVGNLYWTYVVALITYYQKVSDYAKAVELGEYAQSEVVYSKGFSELDSLIGIVEQNTFYMTMGDCYEKLGMDKEALTCLLKSLNYICEQTVSNLAPIYRDIAIIYDKLHDNKNALEYYLKSLDNWNKFNRSSDNIEIKAQILMSIGVNYNQMSRPLTAITYLEQAKNIYLTTNSTEYLTYTYGHLSLCYHSVGNLEKSTIYAELFSDSIVGGNRWTDEQFLICYSIYGDILKQKGKYHEAITAYNKVISNMVQLYGNNDSRIYTSYSKLAQLYLDIEDFDNAQVAANKALDIATRSDQITERIRAQLLLIHIEWRRGNIGTAISDCELIGKQIKLLNDSSELRYHYYATLATMYRGIGAYENTEEIDKLNLAEQKKRYTDNSPEYAMALLKLSEYYNGCDKRAEAVEHIIQALNILKEIYGERSSEYYTALHLLGVCYFDNPDKSIEIYANCMRISKELYGDKSNQYADDMMLLYSNRILKDVNSISIDDLNLYISGINIKRDLGTTNNIFYLTELSLLSEFYALIKDYDNLYLCDKEYYLKVKEYLKNNFNHLIEWQRHGLWGNFQRAISYYIPSHAIKTNMPIYNELAYNCALLNKALLLTSSNKLAELIYNSDNEQLKNMHKKILTLKEDLTKMKDPSLYKQMEQMLKELQRKEIEIVKSEGVFTDYIDIDWTDVQHSLNLKEAAIEFVSYPTQDCISYAALVITHNSSCPAIIPLFNDKEFEKYNLEDDETSFDYTNHNMFRIIWDRLENYALDGIETIYFAPDGILHKIPIESLVDNTGKTASQKWNLYRVSSTREVISKKTNNNVYNIVLFGGLLYDLDSEQLIAKCRSGEFNTEKTSRKVDLSSLRYGVKYLPGTKKEVEDIYQQLKVSTKVSCDTIIGISGIEESFKALANKSIGIIHIATHGFFWNEDDARKRDDVTFLNPLNNAVQSTEDKALLRSGLFFSGANIGLKGEPLPDDVEDGVLTALELSNMNLGNVDMVVLSACDSGLGETSGEGVFGLQRGFKLAGANTLLMSLWKVDDTATRLLMTEFYRNYLSGKTKQESLRLAQQSLRDNDNYSDPQYWAAFILLDGLN